MFNELMEKREPGVSGKGVARGVKAIGWLILLLVVVPYFGRNVTEHLDAKDIMIIQSVRGNLNVCLQPGYYGQWFGTVSKYQRRSQDSFFFQKEQGRTTDQSLSVMFYDGGAAHVFRVMSLWMPTP